jgi:hypothetical protein
MTTATDPTVPPTEPIVQQRRKASPATPTTIAGKLLAPEIIAGTALAPRRAPEIADEAFWFHVGALPGLPVNCAHVAGVEFPKESETVSVDRIEGRTTRYPHPGAIVRLTRRQVRAIGEALPYKVARFALGPGEDPADAFQKSLDATAPGARPRNGAVLSIPTAAAIAEAKANGSAHGGRLRFIPQAADQPLASLIYCTWLDNESPTPQQKGTPLPEALSITGLTIPPPGARAVPSNERLNLPVG